MMGKAGKQREENIKPQGLGGIGTQKLVQQMKIIGLDAGDRTFLPGLGDEEESHHSAFRHQHALMRPEGLMSLLRVTVFRGHCGQ